MAHHKIKRATPDEDDITIIIPAAGKGRRMKSYGPKPLIEIKNKSIIDRQIKILRSVFRDPTFVIVCGFEADKVMDQTPDFLVKLENENYEDTNVCRSLSIALRAVSTKRALIVYGDLVFTKQAISEMDYNISCTSAGKDSSREGEVGCIIDDSGTLINMMYDLELKWNQILYLQGRELHMFKHECQNRRNSKRFSFEIINSIIEQGAKIKCIVDKNIKVVDIDTSRDLIRAEELA